MLLKIVHKLMVPNIRENQLVQSVTLVAGVFAKIKLLQLVVKEA
jgi:hypothetical protein